LEVLLLPLECRNDGILCRVVGNEEKSRHGVNAEKDGSSDSVNKRKKRILGLSVRCLIID
jgi:hypothetical protein